MHASHRFAVVLAVIVALAGAGIILAVEVHHHAAMHAQLLQEESARRHATASPAAVPADFAAGTLETLTDNGFTVLTSSAHMVSISITATTTVQKILGKGQAPSAVSTNELTIGDSVVVMGIGQEDGSIVASRISVQ